MHSVYSNEKTKTKKILLIHDFKTIEMNKLYVLYQSLPTYKKNSI